MADFEIPISEKKESIFEKMKTAVADAEGELLL